MNYEINCIIIDKLNPYENSEDPIELSLITSISAESEEDAVQKINSYYYVKEIIGVVQI